MGIKEKLGFSRKPLNLTKLQAFDREKSEIKIIRHMEPGYSLRFFAALDGFEGLGHGSGESEHEARSRLMQTLPREADGIRFDPPRGPACADDVKRGLFNRGFSRANFAGRPIVLENVKTGVQMLWTWQDDEVIQAPVFEFIAAAAGLTVKELEDASGVTAAREYEAAAVEHLEECGRKRNLETKKRQAAEELAHAKRRADEAKAHAEKLAAEAAKLEGDTAA